MLSEFAGVAWELGEALKVNPYDPRALVGMKVRLIPGLYLNVYFVLLAGGYPSPGP